jgi:hypothetical protein
MSEHNGHSIRVTVQGDGPQDLHDRALKLARQYFDVEQAHLRVGLFEASPALGTWSGEVLCWEAEIVVTLV